MVTQQKTKDEPAEESISMAIEQQIQVKSTKEPISAEQLSQSESYASVDRPEPLIAKLTDTANEDPSSVLPTCNLRGSLFIV